MRFRLLPLFSLFVIALGLSGCGDRDKSADFEEANRSAGGVLLERAFPADTWFAMSFSTLDDAQREGFSAIVAQFTDDPVGFRDEILKGVNTNLASIDLSYVEDIAPILGESGFRFVMGMSDGEDGKTVTHAGVTLANPDQGRSLMELMERKGRFLKKTVSGQEVYFNPVAAEQGENVFYFGLYSDVLLIANDENELALMVNLLKSEGASSFMDHLSYKEVVSELPLDALFSVYMDSEAMTAKREKAVPVATAEVPDTKSVASYLRAQGIAFSATSYGLDFRGVALGDKGRIDADDFSLNQVKAGKVYLDQEMPADQMALYLESYNFAEALERQLGAGGQASLTALGLDPATIDLSQLFGKGYSLALHQNSGFLPGITLMVDVSKGKSAARQLLDQLDQQVASLIALFEFQGGTGLAGAITREKVTISGEEFSVVRLDVDKLMKVYAASGSFALPDQVSGQDVVLVYGITDKDRLVVSTYEGWLDNPHAMLKEDATYGATIKRLEGFSEGVAYVDFDVLLHFVETFGAFRDALMVDATKIHAENAEALQIGEDLSAAQSAIDELEGVDPGTVSLVPAVLAEGPRTDLVATPVMPAVDWVELLKPLRSFAFSSKATQYQVTVGGVVMLEQ